MGLSCLLLPIAAPKKLLWVREISRGMWPRLLQLGIGESCFFTWLALAQVSFIHTGSSLDPSQYLFTGTFILLGQLPSLLSRTVSTREEIRIHNGLSHLLAHKDISSVPTKQPAYLKARNGFVKLRSQRKGT